LETAQDFGFDSPKELTRTRAKLQVVDRWSEIRVSRRKGDANSYESV
jgi:hypothetical protein